MRHFLANIMTYAIAVLLIAGSAAFAWMRTAQLALVTEADVIARYEPAPAGEFRWHELGRTAYERNCANCHGSEGGGWDEYPGLEPAAAIAAAPGGRDYLVDLHLHGLTSDRWGAPMPRMRHMHDAEIAAVLNYILTRFGNAGDDALFVPDEIRDRRRGRLSPADVNRRRPVVGTAP
jgi:mono/diheme cytochrome c family protein